MTRPRFVPFVCILLAGCSGAMPEPHTSAPGKALAVVNVNVIPMDRDRVLANQTVIIRDGRIAALGPAHSVTAPADALRISGDGRFLVPGLTDFHVHLRNESELLSYLSHGVTRVVHLSGPTGELPDVVNLRKRVAAGEVLGPTIHTTGKMLDGDPPIFPAVSTAVGSPQEAERVVAEQSAAGVDFIKVYNNLSSDSLRAAVESAHQRGLAVIGHIPRKDGRDEALQIAFEAGLDLVAHGEEYFFTRFYADASERLDRGLEPDPDESLLADVARLTRESQAAVIPNLSFIAMTRRLLDDPAGVFEEPEARFLSRGVREMWHEQSPAQRRDLDRFRRSERAKYPFVQALTGELQDAGVLLLLGTDASAPGLFPGKSAHLELAELVGAGLTPFEALATGTRNAGQFISRHAPSVPPFGLVTPGQHADLILLRANPLTNIQNVAAIEGVILRGRWYSAEDLAQLREGAAGGRGGDEPGEKDQPM